MKSISVLALLLVCSSAFAQSDFVRGDKVVFEDNFANEREGSSPSKWRTAAGGKAEITQVNGEKVIWFPVKGTTIKTPENFLPENFTIECEFTIPQSANGEWKFSLAHSDGSGEHARVSIQLNYKYFFAFWQGRESNNSSGSIDLLRAGWNRLALSYNNGDLQIFVNGRRLVNVSGVQPTKMFVAQLSNYRDEPGKNMLLRNIRICSIKSTIPETTNTKPPFVPGAEIIFEDKFASENVGAAPGKWNLTYGKAQIARLNNENVLLFPERTVITPSINATQNYLPDSYTVELEFYAPRGKIGRWGVAMQEAKSDKEVSGVGWTSIVGSMSSKTTAISIAWKTNFAEDLEASDIFVDLSKEGWHRLAVSYHQGVFNVYINGTHLLHTRNVAKAGWLSISVNPTETTGFYLRNVRIAKIIQ